MKKKLFILLIILNINIVSAKETLVDHITNLYNDAEKSIIENNEIEYNYATSVNLMNDRLGGVTESLDGGNIRYYGASPNNYIDIGDRTSDNEVILWRIIGVFDGKVRIVRNESIGNYSWDTGPVNTEFQLGINQWGSSGDFTGAALMKLLNPGYEDNKDLDNGNNKILVNNSLYWNSENGTCYNGDGNKVISCDFTSSGLSNNVKDYIIDQTIYFGRNTAGNESSVDKSYLYERSGQEYYEEDDNVLRTSEWIGKVGLIYVSDYGYASLQDKCNYYNSFYINRLCIEDNWLSTDYDYWSISRLGYIYSLFIENSAAIYGGSAPCESLAIRPTLMLDKSIVIKSGNGSKDDPYVIGKEDKYRATINYYGEDGKLLDIDNNPRILNDLTSGYTEVIKSPKVSGCYAKDVKISITDKDEVYDVYYNCSVIVNPKTGRLLIILGVIFSIASIGYLVYYIRNKKFTY